MTEARDMKAVFERIADVNHWGSEESVSGAGSTLAYTHNLRHELALCLRDFRIHSLFDAPCGDFNWMRHVTVPEGLVYTGGDIAASVIAANQRAYETQTRRFMEFDIARDPFPQADLWFCRDCLFHLPYAAIFEALAAFCRSGVKYAMLTNHLNTTNFVNHDIEPGDFRLIDLHLAPFHLPRQALFRVADYVFPFPQREMCVWTRGQIAEAIEGRG